MLTQTTSKHWQMYVCCDVSLRQVEFLYITALSKQSLKCAQLGVLLQQKAQFEASVNMLEKALALRPDELAIMNNLAISLSRSDVCYFDVNLSFIMLDRVHHFSFQSWQIRGVHALHRPRHCKRHVNSIEIVTL